MEQPNTPPSRTSIILGEWLPGNPYKTRQTTIIESFSDWEDRWYVHPQVPPEDPQGRAETIASSPPSSSAARSAGGSNSTRSTSDTRPSIGSRSSSRTNSSNVRSSLLSRLGQQGSVDGRRLSGSTLVYSEDDWIARDSDVYFDNPLVAVPSGSSQADVHDGSQANEPPAQEPCMTCGDVSCRYDSALRELSRSDEPFTHDEYVAAMALVQLSRSS